MILDFRVRPPYGEFLNLAAFNPPCNSKPPQMYHARRSESAHQKSMPLFLEEMREAGISRSVIMSRTLPDSGKSITNEGIREAAGAYPDLFTPFGGIDVSCGIANALAELEKCASYGFKGIVMEPGQFDPPLKVDAAQLYPIYARCEQLSLPVVLTMSFKQGPTLEYSNPAAVQNVASDFPLLQIVITHACYPWLPHIFSISLMHPNIWLIPDLYIHNPMAPGNEMFTDGVRWLDGDRLLFATSYPCYDMRQAVEDFMSMDISAEHREKMLHLNAEKLLSMTGR